jgi:hypothetical protein
LCLAASRFLFAEHRFGGSLGVLIFGIVGVFAEVRERLAGRRKLVLVAHPDDPARALLLGMSFDSLSDKPGRESPRITL